MFGPHIAGDGTAWFDDLALESYSSSSLPPPSEAVAAYIDAVLDLMQEHSIVRESVRWDRFRESALRSVRGMDSIQQAHVAVSALVRRLGDNHSGFVVPETGAREQSPAQADSTAWVAPAAQLLEGRFG